jgi:hypothetical protein
MKPYLLLRNNIQSGPYSVEELNMLGLKPFDLIWVEGKSFSWKYPTEIDELSSLAASVEQDISNIANNIKEKKLSAVNESVSQLSGMEAGEAKIVPFADSGTEKSVEHHSIVAFPPKIEHVEARTIKSPTVIKVQIRDKENTEYLPAQEPIASGPASFLSPERPAVLDPGKQAVELETKFAQPMDEIREKFIESRVITPRKLRDRNILEIFVLILGAASLLGIGFLFGNSGKDHEQVVADNSNTATKDLSQKELYEALAPERTQIPEETPPAATKLQEPGAIRPIKKEKPKTNPNIGKVVSVPVASQESQQAAARPAEKEKQPADDKKDYARQHVYDLVTVKNSDYKRKFLGGITGLKFTVTNGTAYTIDEVTIEVSYIKNNGDVYKTEKVVVGNLWPGAVYTADAPSTSKGVKVTFKISSIRSKDLGI